MYNYYNCYDEYDKYDLLTECYNFIYNKKKNDIIYDDYSYFLEQIKSN